MARIIDGPEITGQVVHKLTGQAYGPVTVTVTPKVYTDREMTSSTTSLTTDGQGVFSCYAPPGLYTFTTTAADAGTLEPVEVLGHEGGTGTPNSAAFQAVVAAPTGTPATDRTAIQTALDAAAAAGGGRVLLTKGATYTLDMVAHPTEPTIGCCLVLDSHITFDLNGATIKVAASQTTPAGVTGDVNAGTAQLHILTVKRPYSNLLASHTHIAVCDGTIDGNAANQTLVMYGAWLNRTRSAWYDRLKVKNCRGTATSGAGETFHYEANNCTDVHYRACEATHDDAGVTATGFSADNSTGVTWTDCTAHDMTNGQGFTHWQSGALTYVGCRAYSNGACGFNTERSEDVLYAGCQSGIRSAPVATAQPGPFWASVGQTAGNGDTGFMCQGSVIVDYVNCHARYNVSDGVQIKDNTAISPTIVSNQVRIIGGQYGPGNGTGVVVASTATNVVFVGHVETSGNTATDAIPGGPADTFTAALAGAPQAVYRNMNDSSGMRFNVVRSNGTSPPTGFGYRWSVGGGLAMTITTGLDLVVGRSLRPAQFTTAGRPGASSVGAGAVIYDTTLSKPVWSDGTVWRDSAGTAV